MGLIFKQSSQMWSIYFWNGCLPAKIRPAWRPPGQKGFLPVNCRLGETFLGAIL